MKKRAGSMSVSVMQGSPKGGKENARKETNDDIYKALGWDDDDHDELA